MSARPADFMLDPGSVRFPHRHAAHCESGVIATLISCYGHPLTEPMAFGLAAGMTFVHFPLIKVGGIPLTAYRMPPGYIMRGVARHFGLKMASRRFRNADEGMRDLDRLLSEGRIVGMQTSVYWLPYFPKDMRFHFNAHNLIVFGKEGNDYLISDPVIERPVRCAAEALKRARFAKGRFAPRGFVYYPASTAADIDLDRAVRKSIRKTVNMMLRAPLPWVGVKGIRRLAKTFAKLDARTADDHYRKMFVGSVIRMQEEIGTGGGGFRFIYASYLQEAGTKLGNPKLIAASEQMTAVGDQWRMFAVAGANFCKGHRGSTLGNVRDELLKCADMEEAAYRNLLRL